MFTFDLFWGIVLKSCWALRHSAALAKKVREFGSVASRQKVTMKKLTTQKLRRSTLPRLENILVKLSCRLSNCCSLLESSWKLFRSPRELRIGKQKWYWKSLTLPILDKLRRIDHSVQLAKGFSQHSDSRKNRQAKQNGLRSCLNKITEEAVAVQF